MIPPRCYVCALDLFDVPDDGRKHFTLIYFGKDDDAKMAHSRQMATLGRDGHPRNAVWFCNQHADIARQYEGMDAGAALRAIDAAMGRTPRAKPGV